MLACVVLGASSAFASTTGMFAIDTDTYVDSLYPATNYGTSNVVKVVVNGGGSNNSLVRGLFCLPADALAIPAEDVVSARVWFYTFKNSTGDRSVELHPLTSAFNEAEATWSGPTAGASWATGGGDYDASTSVTAIEGTNWFCFDITSLWSNANLRTYGAMLKMNDESMAGASSMPRAPFTSSDGTTASERPYVEITCTPEPAALVMLAMGGVLVLRKRWIHSCDA
jgi:hypothetical protein